MRSPCSSRSMWATTMTTSDLPKETSQLISQADKIGAQSAAAAGLPDPDVVAKLANEFFRAVSEPTQATDLLTATIPSTSQLEIPTAAAIPSEEQLRALPATLSETNDNRWPEIPGGISAGDFSSGAAFSFLEEARSLFNTVPATPVQSLPQA